MTHKSNSEKKPKPKSRHKTRQADYALRRSETFVLEEATPVTSEELTSLALLLAQDTEASNDY